ncbi:MAG: hypothetical protein H7A21_05940 [Spirochaetales bacterium]|nr:hypothetical protein [Leptospiraceae bacterium]MCP5480951.1 hypothetical protein [Spirochaetales bacterium]MCP5485331.1 hypothetical protein [Spirochaetales bacterium]
MNIFVNEQQLDAELTDEQNLEQVYAAVNNWIADHKRYILGMRVDSQEVSLSALKELPTSEVQRVDFYVGDELDMVLTTLDELDRYVDQIGSTLFELHQLSESDRTNLSDGMAWIRQILNSFSSIMHIDLGGMNVLVPGSQGSEAIDRILERLERRTQLFGKENNREAIEDFLEDLRSFKFFIMKLALQLRTMNARQEDLVKQVEKFEAEIPAMADEIASINESFNAGRDQKALETLDSTTDRLNAYLSALFALDYQLRRKGEKSIHEVEVASVPFHALASELTGMLRDLSGALEENDIVAAGDILEYELTDKLRGLRPYLSEIRQLVLATN